MLLWAGCAARARLLQDHIPDWFSFRRRRRRQLDSEVKLDSLSSPKHPGLVPTLPCTTKGATAACSSFPSFPFKPSWIPVSVRLASRSSYLCPKNSAIKPPEFFFFFSTCSTTAACKPCVVLDCRRFPGAHRVGLQRVERGVFNPPEQKAPLRPCCSSLQVMHCRSRADDRG